jgi:rhodanese-related sulfurtransferase
MIDQIRPAAFAPWAAAQQQQHGATPLVLDVRETWEFNTAAVRTLSNTCAFDVLSIPMQEIPQRLAELPDSRTIACLCHHGVRSQQVARYLQQNGFEHVANIAGGIDAWSAELDPAVPRY